MKFNIKNMKEEKELAMWMSAERHSSWEEELRRPFRALVLSYNLGFYYKMPWRFCTEI